MGFQMLKAAATLNVPFQVRVTSSVHGSRFQFAGPSQGRHILSRPGSRPGPARASGRRLSRRVHCYALNLNFHDPTQAQLAQLELRVDRRDPGPPPATRAGPGPSARGPPPPHGRRWTERPVTVV